jgi:hypothetical protein
MKKTIVIGIVLLVAIVGVVIGVTVHGTGNADLLDGMHWDGASDTDGIKQYINKRAAICSTLDECTTDDNGKCIIATDKKSELELNLKPENIIQGISIFGVAGTAAGGGGGLVDADGDGIISTVDSDDSDPNDATATAADVRTGKTFYTNGARKTGTSISASSTEPCGGGLSAWKRRCNTEFCEGEDYTRCWFENSLPNWYSSHYCTGTPLISFQSSTEFDEYANVCGSTIDSAASGILDGSGRVACAQFCGMVPGANCAEVRYYSTGAGPSCQCYSGALGEEDTSGAYITIIGMNCID